MTKHERHCRLKAMIKENPFLKDEELSKQLGVSVSTIRIDRAELGIAEYRERVKTAAEDSKVQQISHAGEVIDMELFHSAISVLETDNSMLFPGTDIIKSQHIYALAEELALNVIDAKAALVKVANVKYVSEVHEGEKLVAHSTVIRKKENNTSKDNAAEYIVHVIIKVRMNEVFRGKFSLSIK
ncbi:MAG: fatty acid biosynthesis transcriptional regulator [bacterium]|nr:fatty acid biosynthesis transcriptional regulator [bacterium]